MNDIPRSAVWKAWLCKRRPGSDLANLASLLANRGPDKTNYELRGFMFKVCLPKLPNKKHPSWRIENTALALQVC